MVDLTIEEGQRLKVVYGSSRGFHAVDLDTMDVFDIYVPQHVRRLTVSPFHSPFPLNSNFLQCFDAVGWATGRASGL